MRKVAKNREASLWVQKFGVWWYELLHRRARGKRLKNWGKLATEADKSHQHYNILLGLLEAPLGVTVILGPMASGKTTVARTYAVNQYLAGRKVYSSPDLGLLFGDRIGPSMFKDLMDGKIFDALFLLPGNAMVDLEGQIWGEAFAYSRTKHLTFLIETQQLEQLPFPSYLLKEIWRLQKPIVSSKMFDWGIEFERLTSNGVALDWEKDFHPAGAVHVPASEIKHAHFLSDLSLDQLI